LFSAGSNKKGSEKEELRELQAAISFDIELVILNSSLVGPSSFEIF
jgi:hypothetical protein